jgi:type IV secretory pathway VirB10-like protein
VSDEETTPKHAPSSTTQASVDPRRLASLVVRRVGRAPLVFGGTLLLLALWTSAFLLSENQRKAPRPEPKESSTSNELDPSTHALVQRFLEESRRQARQEAAARYEPAYPADDMAADFSPPPGAARVQLSDNHPGEGPLDSEAYREVPSGSYEQPPARRFADPSRDTPRHDSKDERLARALEAPPIVSASLRPAEPDLTAPASMGDLLDATERLARLAQQPGAPNPALGEVSPTVLKASQPQDVPDVRRTTRSLAPNSLAAGSLIPTVLMGAVNSDAPGLVTAVVSHDVYDSLTGSALLVPAGSRLLGTSGAAAQGQTRLAIAWVRLTLPDGTLYDLGSMPAADLSGASGIQDRTNRHLARIFSSALLLSAFAASAQLSQPDVYRGGLRELTPQEVAAGAMGQQLNNSANSLIDRELQVPPTLVLRPGTACNVIVTNDLIFPGPYAR